MIKHSGKNKRNKKFYLSLPILEIDLATVEQTNPETPGTRISVRPGRFILYAQLIRIQHRKTVQE